MKKFLLKIALAVLPSLLLVAVYVVTDPFMVIYHYDSYYNNNKKKVFSLNKDYATTEMFLKNNKEGKHFDSYIFGSSRSECYKIDEWRKHVAGNGFFHFDAYKETLFGLEKKVDYLDRNGYNIKNALVVIDYSLLAEISNSEGHVFRKHPDVSGESHLNFQFNVFRDFLDAKFLKFYAIYLASGRVPAQMVKEGLVDTAGLHFDEVANQKVFDKLETRISENPAYHENKSIFHSRSDTQITGKVVIGEKQTEMLKRIRSVFQKHNTSYRIVISPLYDQLKLNETDLQALRSIFGATNVYDFSGINEITANVTNYYEASHYRPLVATKIIDSIYAAR